MKKIIVFNLTSRWWMLHYWSQFCNALAQKYKVMVVLADYYQGDLYNKNIDKIYLTTNTTITSFLKDTLNVYQHYECFKKISKFNPDIVHFIDNHPWYSVYGLILKERWFLIYTTQHDPTLHSWDNIDLKGKVAIFTNKILRRISNKLIVHGDYLKEEMIQKYWINPERITSIPHGNYNFFLKRSKQNIAIQENFFLFFWRIVDYKGLDVLLESLKYIKKSIKDFTLIIAWGWNIEKYRSLLKEHKNYIEVYNNDIPDEDVYKYFDRVEFVVLPYRDATWSGVISVAYAFSKPVIVTNVWELPSVVVDHITWIVTEKNNIAKLAESIIFMLENKEEVIEMWKRWRKFSERELGWDKIIKEVYELK